MPKRDADYMAAKKREILAAARRVAGQRGLAHVTLRDIAAAAGMSLGALATHFENREALIGFAAQEATAQRRRAMAAAFAGGVDGAALARLLTAPETVAALALDVDLVAEARCTRALRRPVAEAAADAVAELAAAVGGHGASEDAPGEDGARMVVALTYGLGALAALGIPVGEAAVARAVTALLGGERG